MSGILALLASAALSQAGGLDVLRDAFAYGDDAWFLGEPQVVTGGTVRDMTWSPDGVYLLVQRDALTGPSPLAVLQKGQLPEAPTYEHQVLIYGQRSQRIVTALRLPATTVINEVQWIPGSSKVLISANALENVGTKEAPSLTFHPVVYWVSGSGEARNIVTGGPRNSIFMFANPRRSQVAILTAAGELNPSPEVAANASSVEFFDSEGRSQGRVPVSARTSRVEWAADGRPFVDSPTVVDRKIVHEFFYLNPTQGTREVATAKPKMLPRITEKNEMEVSAFRLKLTKPEKESVPVIRLVDGEFKPLVTVSSDATSGVLAPNRTAVAYVHKGVAMIRPIAKISKELYLAMRAAAEKQAAIQQAKYAALAVLMNSADHDDEMVGSGSDWKKQLEPYLKDSDGLDGFIYTFPGGNATSIENPSTTEIGYISGPGGRAVAYADGHVRWVPNP